MYKGNNILVQFVLKDIAPYTLYMASYKNMHSAELTQLSKAFIFSRNDFLSFPVIFNTIIICQQCIACNYCCSNIISAPAVGT